MGVQEERCQCFSLRIQATGLLSSPQAFIFGSGRSALRDLGAKDLGDVFDGELTAGHISHGDA